MSNGYLEWDIETLSNSLKIDADSTRTYFTDGRRISFLIERRLSNEVIKGTIAHSEGAGFDLLDPEGGKWEVRSISKNVYFCPSYMVGSGRSFIEEGFIKKLEEIRGYILSDISQFPKVPYWIVKKEDVWEWYKRGKLGPNTLITRSKILELLK